MWKSRRALGFRSNGPLVRNFFEGETLGARPEDADGQDDHQHARRDECENTFGAEVLKKKRNHEAREYCREAAPGINKSDRASPDASGKKFGLIGMQRIRQQIIGERDEHSAYDQQHRRRLSGEEQAEASRADRGGYNLPFAFILVGN